MGPKPIVGSESCCTSPPNPLAPIATYGKVGGRVTSLATDPGNSSIVYAGTAGGGVWKSTDAGATWSSTSAGQASLAGAQGASAIGALAIDPNNSLIVYAATGEDNLSDSQPGWGILKSTDGGTTWTVLGPATLARQHIGGIVVDRTNSQRVIVAADNGLFQSLDGGTTWNRVTIPSSNITPLSGQTPAQAATQIIQDPTTAGKFWLSVSDFCVKNAGDILTWDGASTWSTMAFNFTGLASRIGLGVAPNGVAYFSAADCMTNDLADIEKTADGGAHWTTIFGSGSPVPSGLTNYFNAGGGGQGDYDNVVSIDPFDTTGKTVVFGGVTALVTLDGGGSFIDVVQPYNGGFVHPDFHAVAFTSSGHFYTGNDGGVWSTADWGGANTSTPAGQSHWSNLNATLGAVQFYAGTALDASNLLGGTQDNGSPGSFNPPGVTPAPGWQEFLDGDGGYTAIDPTPNSSVIYAEVPRGDIFRGSRVKMSTNTSPYDSFNEAGPCRSSFNSGDPACTDPTSFVAPFSMDPTNSSIMVAGTNRVYRSFNGGGNGGPSGWAPISGDLTTGTSNFVGKADRLSVVSIGPTGIAGPVITGSMLGAVFYTPNGSANTPTWTNITGNLPQPSSSPSTNTFIFPNPWISGAVVNPSNASEAWVTIGGINTFTVWHTLNAGAGGGTQWSELSGVTPPSLGNEVVNGIALDPTTSTPSAVYVATDTGVFVCNPCTGTTADTAATWTRVGTGLPNVKVNAITFTRDQQTLIAWTHGLGAWSIPASGWQKIGGRLASRPVAPTPATTQLDAFVLGGDQQIWHTWLAGNTWHWEGLSGTVTSDPSAVIAAPGTLDAFARGGDSSLLQNHWNGFAWTGWQSRGGKLAAEPSAVATGGGGSVAFVKGTDSHLWYWDSSTGWHLAGGILNAGPAGAMGTAGAESDAFVQGSDNHLWYWSSATGWHLAGGVLADKPAAIVSGPGRLDAFVRGTDQALWHWSNATGATGAWDGAGGRIANRPTAVSLGLPRLDAFVQGTDNNLWHARSSGTGWQWEQLLGASTGIDPAATVSTTQINIYVRNSDLSLWYRNLQ